MKTKLLYPFGIAVAILLFIPFTKTKAQTCSANIANGQNLTVNGDFAQGNTSFTYSTGATGYAYYTCPTPMPNSSCFSGPGQILVGAHSDWFNQGFNMGTAGFGNPIADHSPGADNNMLMVDGTCTAGNDAWAQVIPVQQNTWYYFECWVTNLNVAPGANGNASLNLNINNSPALVFTPPAATQGNWVHYSVAWFSGTSTTADLAIQNTTSVGCGTGVDFGLDDITFTPGCAYADATTPQPLLGADGTLCGKNNAGIVLNSNITAVVPPAGRTITWLQGTPGSIISSANNSLTYTATAAGTYTVCVQNTGGCLKSDVIVISATYSLSLPSTITLCNPPSATLNPGFGGPGVTYKWEKATSAGGPWTTITGLVGSGPTYLANGAGFYRVTTTDPTPGCGTKTSNVTNVTSQQTATPNNVSFCPPGKPTFSITGAAGSTYQWYTNAAGTTQVSPATTGTSYTPGTNIGTTGDPAGTQYTYYVKDITYYTETNVGAQTLPASGNQQTQLSQYGTAFDAAQPFIIDSMTVYWWLNNSNPTDPLTIQFQLTNNPAGTTTPTNISTSAVYSATNATAKMTPAFPTSSSGIYAVRVPVGISIPSAGSYRLTAVNATTTGNVQIQQSGTSYPYNDPAGVLSIFGTAQNGNPVGTTFYGDMYKWRIRYQLDCLPIPVIATKDCALPVTFLSFTTTTDASSVHLNWATVTEINSAHFIIEKSKDGIHFSSIGKVDAAGASTIAKQYSFTDNSLESGLVYYRLVEFDIDGSSLSSEVKTVNSRLADVIKIIPNPNNGNFTLSIEGETPSTFHLALYNSLGENVYQSNEITDSKVYFKNMEMHTLPSGIYFLHVQSGTKRWMEKVVKQ